MIRTTSIPKPIELKNLTVTGELAARTVLNFGRLEGKWYRPWEVFMADQHGWPGDWEGRIILALVSQAQCTHREPAWLEEIMRSIPEHLNAAGYFGPIMPDGVCDEQQLAGHSWFLRGLLAHYQWKGDKEVLCLIETILRNLVLSAAANYTTYPVSLGDLENVKGWQLSKLQSKGKSHALSSDLGCGFILLDGVTDAYACLGWPELKEMAEVMIERFLKVDLEALHIQTHATLTALRGICRFAELTGDRRSLDAAKCIFNRYKQVAMTEHYGNHNWWGRPRWTEPCAIIDSYILAVWLWRLTGEAQFLADSHHIFYTGVGHAFRADGCFGTDWCLGSVSPAEDGEHNPLVLQTRTYEVYWCCTMRGGELFARACESTFFADGSKIILASYHNATAEMGGLTLRETTAYPCEGKVKVEILGVSQPGRKILSFFVPPWGTKKVPLLAYNGTAVQAEPANGFIEIAADFVEGDIVELEFGVGLHVQRAHNLNSVEGVHSFRHGPLLLVLNQCPPELWGSENPVNPATIDALSPDTEFEYLGKGRYMSRADQNIVLTPVYNIEELIQPWHARQGLFFAGGR